MFYTTFTHPIHGEQHTDRPTKEELKKWLSYMVFAHQITNVRTFEGGRKNPETFEYEGGTEFNLQIPKW